MVLEFDDCANVVKVLHPEYDCIFLFDHGCGNDRKRLDRLCSIFVQKKYGGKEPKMRETKIELNKYLGLFTHKISVVQVGSIQRMHFVSSDAGLYCCLVDSQGERIEQDGLPDKEEDKAIPKQARSAEKLGRKRHVN